jgi:uncharacterized membrane protein HdeD (DUF308 family)
MIILGVLCMAAPKISGLAAVVYLGALLALSGLLGVIVGLREKDGEHQGAVLAGGLFSLGAGVLMMARPEAGLAALTLLLAGYLVAIGLHTALSGQYGRYRGRIGDIVFGAVTVLVGVVAVASWPISTIWLIGTLVGIAIVTRGATVVAMAFAAERSVSTPAVRPA